MLKPVSGNDDLSSEERRAYAKTQTKWLWVVCSSNRFKPVTTIFLLKKPVTTINAFPQL